MAIRVGIIGTGWGLMHVGGFRAAGAEVTALVGRDAEKTRQLAEQQAIAFSTSSLEALWPHVDAVVVASPDALHAEHAQAALRAGKHVLCEKPLTATAEEAKQLHALDGENPALVCALNLPYRFLPSVRALKAWLQGREVERVVGFVRNGFLGRDDQSADLGGTSHLLDVALWLSGQALHRVRSASSDAPIPDATFELGLVNHGRVVVQQVATQVPGIDGQWLLAGRDWEVRWQAGYDPGLGGWRLGPVTALENGTSRELLAEVVPREGAREPWAEAHVEVARAYLQAVHGERVPELATFREGALLQRLIDAARTREASL